jgi:hypothetical protein
VGRVDRDGKNANDSLLQIEHVLGRPTGRGLLQLVLVRKDFAASRRASSGVTPARRLSSICI